MSGHPEVRPGGEPRRTPPTEGRHPQSAGLDLLETRELVDLLVRDQSEAVAVVRAQAATLVRVVEAIVERVQRGGRVHYVGAGTSGRLGVLDASEMPPTFGTPPALVCAHIAGGDRALREAVEGAEDDGGAGERAMDAHVVPDDVVVGISASGGAPFVIAALERAREIGALTVAITSSDDSALVAAAALAIVLPTGAEVLSGSTRLKAGTAQKITLNTLSTAVMVRLGKVHDNLMVDVVATNEKLRGRAERLVRELTGAGDARVRAALEGAAGSVKVAVVMLTRDVDAEAARALLQTGSLRSLL
ncbi:MAG TPA: N-acetylmuramic acid 6-phosphate etherase [Candidatus Acidoferrum sp.]|nr:N-acetylmuramic acid 6-phosphate etherase [Candidatus Acidoferrum sp.]